MRMFKRGILVLSLAIVFISLFSFTNITEIANKPEVEKNLLNGLPGENNQILVVKIDDTKVAHPQIGIEQADVVYVELQSEVLAFRISNC